MGYGESLIEMIHAFFFLLQSPLYVAKYLVKWTYNVFDFTRWDTWL